MEGKEPNLEFSNAQETERPTSERSAYLKIIALDEIPETPENLPDQIFIPAEALGDMGAAIRETLDDFLEREQGTFIDGGGGFKNSELYVGTEDSGRTGRDNLERVARNYFGKRALFSWHTHPPGFNSRFSERDWSHVVSHPRDSYMEGLLTPYELKVLVRTKKSLKIPLSSTATSLKIQSLLDDEIIDAEFKDSDEIRLAEEYGFGFYAVRNPNSHYDDSWYPDDFANGLMLTRVEPK